MLAWMAAAQNSCASATQFMAVENSNFLFARMYMHTTTAETRVEWLDKSSISVQLRLITQGPTEQVTKSFTVADVLREY
jgi:hypothetical protein